MDFEILARRYRFAGGHIKNAMLTAISLMGEGESELSMAHLDQAARRQADALAHLDGMGRMVSEEVGLAGLSVRQRDRETLRRAAGCLPELAREELGTAFLVTAQSVQAARDAAVALAGEAGMPCRQVSMHAAFTAMNNEYVDYETQEKLTPLDAAFAEMPGYDAVTLFVDDHGLLDRHAASDDDGDRDMADFLRRVANGGRVVMVAACRPGSRRVPPEVGLVVELGLPPEDEQIAAWQSHLAMSEDEAMEIVERHPMDTEDILNMARQARVLASVRDQGERWPEVVNEVLRRRSTTAPVWFGKRSG